MEFFFENCPEFSIQRRMDSLRGYELQLRRRSRVVEIFARPAKIFLKSQKNLYKNPFSCQQFFLQRLRSTAVPSVPNKTFFLNVIFLEILWLASTETGEKNFSLSLGIHFDKLKMQSTIAEVYLEPSRISAMKLFAKATVKSR